MPVMRVGVVGCGVISELYLLTLKQFAHLEVVACADLARDRAEARAKQFGLRAVDVDELLTDPEVDVVLNLTPPQAHATVSLAALEAGKHVYQEKPFALDREEGRRVLGAAMQHGLRVGSAPDTFLGGSWQTARELLDSGRIGSPVAVTAAFLSRGHEDWHPDPTFYYRAGGGPMLDMGPYYLTALVFLLGPIQRVTAATKISFPTRKITSQPRYGEIIDVEVPTHVAGVLEFESGALGTLVTSFDVYGHQHAITVYGTEGTLFLSDPNTFGGDVRLLEPGDQPPALVPIERGFTAESRGLGVADFARAIGDGRPHRANGNAAFHVLDTMIGFHDSADTGRHLEIESTCERPELFARGEAEAWLTEL